MGGRNFSISLGVNRYADAQLGDLSFAESDARTIHELARDVLRYGERSLLLPQSINSVQFMDDVREFLVRQQVKVQDRIVLYFAGHGVQSTRGGDHYLLLSRARIDPLQQGHLAGNDVLSVRALLNDLDRYHAEFVLVLDACRHPPGTKDDDNVYDNVQSVLQGLAPRDVRLVRSRSAARGPAPGPVSTRHLIVNSCGDKGRAHEITTLRQGLFASALAGWVRETVQAGGPAVLDRKAIDALGQRMNDSARQAGITVRQQPWISSDSKGFVLYMRGDSDGPAAAARQAAAAVSPATRPPAGPAPETAVPSAATPAAAHPAPTRTTTENFRDVDAPWCPVVRILGFPLVGTPRFRLAVAVDPVTVAQFLALTPGEDLRQVSPARPRPQHEAQPQADAPVTWVTRPVCQQWLARFNAALRRACGPAWPEYRLLTNDEWSYACTCGLHAHYVIGTVALRSLGHDDAVFRYSEIDDGRRYPPDANPRAPAAVHDGRNKVNHFGLRGMHGNVRELATTTTAQTLLMGGGFRSGPAKLRAGSFDNATPDVPQADVGFRIARALRLGELA